MGSGHNVRGEKNGRSRLTEKQVKAIRIEYQKRLVTMGQLGEKYGVSRETIYQAIHRITWKHI